MEKKTILHLWHEGIGWVPYDKDKITAHMWFKHGIHIGDNVTFAEVDGEENTIYIENDCYIGNCATIGANTFISRSAIIQSGADVPDGKYVELGEEVTNLNGAYYGD